MVPGSDELARLYVPFGHFRVNSRDSPVSSKLLRLAIIPGQPFETASISFESS